jgi:hypothetical protein
MIVSLKNKQGYATFFAIIIMLAMMISATSLSVLIHRSIARVGDMWASDQAQCAANATFEHAIWYIGEYCDAGCDESDADVIEEDSIWGDFSIQGKSAQNIDTADADYYVPIPGQGSAGENCDPEAPGDIDDTCNWNRIDYGESVDIPLYVDGDAMSDVWTFYIKVRTPECDDDNVICSSNNRRLIECDDGSVSEVVDGCDYEDDPVVMTWQIWGECDGASCYAEGNPLAKEDRSGKSRSGEDTNSEIFATLINDQLDELIDPYIVLDIDSGLQGSSESEDIFDLLDSEMEYPVLKLSFVQTISNSEGPIPYLEYQIVTDEAISSDKSFISVIGYTVSNKGDTFFWQKDGTYSQFSSSPINFVFQN